MNRFYSRTLAVLSVFLVPVLLHAQKIDSMMKVYADNFPQEKIYVQFDKNLYTPGQTVWFKAYIFSGAEPSQISKNFYAELSDDNGNVVQRRSAPVFESAASGSFDIPASFKSNHYHFRAYTSWMLNFDTAFLFEKDIRVIHPLIDSGIAAPATEEFLRFFPEGGEVVAGLENNIAFKATDQYGMPISIKAVLKDASGKDILELLPAHDGMGKFLLMPDKGDAFYAVWKDAKGKEYKADFPPVKPEGINLRVMNPDKKTLFSITRTSSTSTDYDRLIVIAHMNQQLVYKATVNLQDNLMSGGSIPTDQLPSGILQITVFNSHNVPLAERVVFVNNHEFQFTSNVLIESKSTAKRGYNTVVIEVPDTLRSNLSLAVTDLESDGRKTNDDNIISRLLLTGELKGYVYHPFYYFSNTSDSSRLHLDLVMLTNGWRRFKWDQLALGKKPVIKYPNQEYLALRAEVLGVDPTRLSSSEGINVILKKKDSSIQILDVPKMSGGKFGIAGLVFYDTAKAYYQFNVNRKLSSEAAIIFNNGLFNGYRQSRALNLSYNGWTADDSVFLKKNRFVLQEAARIQPFLDKKVQTLETVTVRARQKSANQKLEEQYVSGMFSGGDAYTFNIMNDPVAAAYGDIFSYLAGKVGGLQVVTDATGATSLTWRGTPTTLYLDEMKVTAQEIRSLVSVPNVAMVKVFRPGAMMALGGGAGGTVAIYTRKGGDRVSDPSVKGLEQVRLIGYSPVREFYSPDYLQKTEVDDVEDIRTTLYWNPFILMDKNSKRTSINFYNSDITKKIRVVLEGFNAEGKLTRVEKVIE
ncbi:MAG TPA: hypothetical protein VK543_09305 [Puia sp.]|nr:hypothetical protein [Puia sp.]